MEQALSSILDYIETENIKTGLEFLNERSFPRESSGRVDQPGMIATLASWRSRVQIPARPPCSSQGGTDYSATAFAWSVFVGVERLKFRIEFNRLR
jgi:hypothetical protein